MELLEHLGGDTDLANPDLWVQGKMTELLDGERKRLAQRRALDGVARAIEATAHSAKAGTGAAGAGAGSNR